MAEESFIILDTTPSLFEPYSLLEMPDSISSHERSAIAAAASQTKQMAVTLNADQERDLAAMKSLWATSTTTVEPSNEVENSIKTQMEQSISTSISFGSMPNGGAQTNGEAPADAAAGKIPSIEQVRNEPAASSFVSIGNGYNSASLKSTTDASLEQAKSVISLSSSLPKDKLAESFLLGNIDVETMKSNVNSHFPSLMASTSDELDNLKIQTDELNMDAITEAPIREVKKCQNEIEELNKQNVDLQTKIVELQHLIESQQNAQLDEIETDVVDAPKNTVPADEVDAMKRDYEAKIKTLHFELSKAIGDKMDLEDDLKQRYIDELDCLRVNLTANEELYKESVAKEKVLEARNAFLSQEINENQKQMASMQAKIEFLEAQVAQYQKDFETEQASRQEIVHEREQWLSDLQMLQQRTRELLNVAENSAGATALPPQAETQAPNVPEYSCPICMRSFPNYDSLEKHVDRCLERSEID